MPSQTLVSRELADLFGVLSHPDRVRIIEELREGPKDVNALTEALGCRHSRVSQHLALLRTHRLVDVEREGRHGFYHLTRPELAAWLAEGLAFVQAEVHASDRIRTAIREVRTLWGHGEEEAAS